MIPDPRDAKAYMQWLDESVRPQTDLARPEEEKCRRLAPLYLDDWGDPVNFTRCLRASGHEDPIHEGSDGANGFHRWTDDTKPVTDLTPQQSEYLIQMNELRRREENRLFSLGFGPAPRWLTVPSWIHHLDRGKIDD